MQNDSPTTSPLEQLHGPAFGAAPVLDRDAFRALEELADEDDPDLVAELVQLYMDDSAVRMQEVEAGLAASEPDRIGSAAHALKSSSANIGVVSFSKVCAELEECARAADGAESQNLDRMCVQALAMYAEVRATLQMLDTAD